MRLNNLTDDQYKSYAQKLLANWRKFDSFSWSGAFDRDDSDNFYIHYTSHRDSDLLDQSNEETINTHFDEKFKRTENLNWELEKHSHWAFGYAHCITIRVYKRNGKLTREFKEICNIINYLENDHYILNEILYEEKIQEATRQNIDSEAFLLKRKYDLPENWIGDVIYYWDNKDCWKLENTDDRGGWLSYKDIELALRELGIIKDEQITL